jgi:hypothetical protein
MRSLPAILVAALLPSGSPAAAGEFVVQSHNKMMQSHNKNFVAVKSEQVMRAFLRFNLVPSGERAQDRLEPLRDRDALLLPAYRLPSLQSGALGAALLGAGVVFAAHAPGPLRAIVDGPVHVGPALLDGGGMGVGVGGTF